MFKLKFLKSLLFILIPISSFAQVSGTGCRIDDKVYTDYLGNAPAYSPHNPNKRFYGTWSYVPIYNGSGHNQYQGYRCRYINIYPASTYWDGNQNIPIPAENEITSSTFGACVTSTTLGGQVIREGDYITYTYMKPGKCAVAPTTELPLDDYIWVLLLIVCAWGCYMMRKDQWKLNLVDNY